MSRVTNIILSFSIMEHDELGLIRKVNEALEPNRGFIEPDEDGNQKADWYGGSKMLERPTYVAAFNYRDFKTDLHGFIDHVLGLPWMYPESLQIYVCDQEDDEYRVFKIMSC